MFDVAIIGAGPAGATLARLLGGSLRVLLLDRRPLSGPVRDSDRKRCGGLLAPDAQKRIAALGLGLPRGVLTGPQLFAVRTLDLPAGLERFYQRHYINVDREAFDRWTLSLATAADVRTGCRLRSYQRRPDGFEIAFDRGAKSFTERAALLVGADGATSAVRRQALGTGGRLLPARTYLAVQEWYRADSPMPYYSAIFDEEITDFYSWTIPKDGSLLVGAALAPGAGARAKMRLLQERLRRRGFSLGRLLRREGTLLLRPLAARETLATADGVALVGEAGGWISPSSAEGISYAFASAMALARAIRAGGVEGCLARYESGMTPLRRNILLKNWKSRVMYTPSLRRAVMRLGLGSIRMG